jgi:serine kinase of HPr protein (carbohydrate metabolism regulator)
MTQFLHLLLKTFQRLSRVRFAIFGYFSIKTANRPMVFGERWEFGFFAFLGSENTKIKDFLSTNLKFIRLSRSWKN